MELKLDQWATNPPAGFPGALQPPLAKRQAGWANGEEPSAGYFNYAWEALADTQNELANAIAGSGGTLDGNKLDQLLAVIQMNQVKQALNSSRLIHDLGSGKFFRGLARKPMGLVTGSALLAAVGTNATIRTAVPGYVFASQTANSGFTGDFNDVAHDVTLNLFVAVGDSGEIQTTAGPGSWVRRHTGGGEFEGVATNGLGRCVAVGKQLKYSSNGTAWTSAVLPADIDIAFDTLLFVRYGGGCFVATSYAGRVLRSLDGITWTEVIEVSRDGGYNTLSYDPVFGFLFMSGEWMWRSTDGLSWTRIHDSVGNLSGAFAAPHCWLSTSASNAGQLNGRGTFMLNQPINFSIDYIAAPSASPPSPAWVRFIDGQPWMFIGNQIYIGGVI